MLTYLRVRNLAVLEDAEIEFSPGLTVFTGETGAGKTLIVGGLRLLAGGKASSAMIGPFGDEASIDGLVSHDNHEIGLARRLRDTGRSQAFVDSKVVSAATLTKTFGPQLEIAGQHEHLSMFHPGAARLLIDHVSERSDPRVHLAYRDAWEKYTRLAQLQESLGGDLRALERELDLVEHQAREITAADLGALSEESIESMAARLRHSEALDRHAGDARVFLSEIERAMGGLLTSLRAYAKIDRGAVQYEARVAGLNEELIDLRRELDTATEQISSTPDDLERIERKLNQIGELKRKYGRTVEEVRVFGQQAEDRGVELRTLLERAVSIDSDVRAAREDLATRADVLSRRRLETARSIEDSTRAHLADLALSGASIGFTVQPKEPGPNGADVVKLMFASNPAMEMRPIRDIASGGELSRIVLALRLATRSGGGSTLVFDEVDAGIGGETALTLSTKLGELADENQVIVVTHLPQIAARADHHFVVERDETATTVRRVTGEQRVTELARMLAGLPDHEGSRDTALELLGGKAS